MTGSRIPRLISAIAAALVLAACSSAVAPAGVTRVVSTTSFGMCAGYCSTRLEISSGEAALTRSSHGGRGAQELPEKRFTRPLSDAEWEEIARMADTTDLGSLPDVIGCPDCADGGAESLSIERSGETKSITFDFGAEVKEAHTLLERVRALREEMTPKS